MTQAETAQLARQKNRGVMLLDLGCQWLISSLGAVG